MKNILFELRGIMPRSYTKIITIIGSLFILLVWIILSISGTISNTLLPTPWAVLSSFGELHYQDALVRNALYSIKLNLLGYLEAVIISLPLGFVIGLFPVFREAFRKYLDAIRFIPLTAVTGLFICWFGIDDNMKIQFLAFGIAVYLLPVVVQRIIEVDDIYVQTVRTLSIRNWPVIKRVFIPAVLSKVSDDIRVLVAISWTYIIVAELVNKSGGIGALAYLAARQSRIDKVFAILVVIIVIGFVQDKLFLVLDKALFPHKYQGGVGNG
ncbi:MAG: ABC transporter permease subunit [Candidatus Nanoarchaeia archaeon]|nr:ABC transporter permease subunit [Candidatus Nanoarchaeia archaeon]